MAISGQTFITAYPFTFCIVWSNEYNFGTVTVTLYCSRPVNGLSQYQEKRKSASRWCHLCLGDLELAVITNIFFFHAVPSFNFFKLNLFISYRHNGRGIKTTLSFEPVHMLVVLE